MKQRLVLTKETYTRTVNNCPICGIGHRITLEADEDVDTTIGFQTPLRELEPDGNQIQSLFVRCNQTGKEFTYSDAWSVRVKALRGVSVESI